jgi:hypothetical protein
MFVADRVARGAEAMAQHPGRKDAPKDAPQDAPQDAP